MGYNHLKIAQERLVATTLSTGVDSTLIAQAAKKNQSYRIANITGNQIKIQEFTNGGLVHIRGTAEGQTGTFEIWGYPEKGDAEFYGQYTYTVGAMVDDDGLFYVEEFIEVAAGTHTVTILNIVNGKAVLKFDVLGFLHIIALMTVISAGTHKAYLRPW